MKVKFVPQNVEFEIKPGQSVMHVAQDHGIYVKSVCKGVPSCAECRVRIVEGEHNVLPPGSEELSLIGTGHFIDRRRLSCQLKCFGDITVDMNEQIAKEQGLIGGQKKKKLAVKDDRVEDQRAIRGEVGSGGHGDVEDGDDGEEGSERPQREERPPREKREQRPQQNRNQNQNHSSNPNREQRAGEGGGQNQAAQRPQDGQGRPPGSRRRRGRRGGKGGGGGGGSGGANGNRGDSGTRPQ